MKYVLWFMLLVVLIAGFDSIICHFFPKPIIGTDADGEPFEKRFNFAILLGLATAFGIACALSKKRKP